MNFLSISQITVSNIAEAPSHSSTTHQEEPADNDAITNLSTINQSRHCEDITMLDSPEVQLPVTYNIYIFRF